MIALVGDTHSVFIVDRRTGQTVLTLEGHLDDCFSIAWKGHYMATGSQDYTARIWDVRTTRWSTGSSTASPSMASPCEPCVAVLPSKMSPIRSVTFDTGTSGGHILAIGESDDYVHCYDLRRLPGEASFSDHQMTERQTLDFFGEVGGVSLFNDRLYVSIGGLDGLGGIMEFDRASAATTFKLYDP